MRPCHSPRWCCALRIGAGVGGSTGVLDVKEHWLTMAWFPYLPTATRRSGTRSRRAPPRRLGVMPRDMADGDAVIRPTGACHAPRPPGVTVQGAWW